jgi:predicted ATPase/DNA-binding SARP family transcriptional activator/DNA-binding CsgD family transcriptional regulator
MMQPEAPPSKEPEAIRVRLLGAFSVSVGSRTIRQDEWRSKKAATLVKLLALAPGHRMHRERAIDLLWPDSGKKAASNNLRQVLYGARKVLDPTSGSPERYLRLTDEQLVLCPEGQLRVDADAFEEAASTARRSRVPSAYRAAIELFAGELLPENRYEEWAEGRRHELRQLYLTLHLELAGLYQDREEHVLAIETLRKAIKEEPTFEEAHASLMRLFALSGQPERALAQYERLRDALQRGIGTQPTEATRRLHDELVAGRLLPTSPSGPAPPEPSDDARHNLPAPMTSFVGRQREMVEVKRALSMTRLLTLTGAGGTGKTRLALEVARDLVGSYPDGVWFVELAPLSEGGLAAREVVNILGVKERPGEPLTDTLAEALAGQETLLVLDNCEHVVDAVARLVDTLLAACPRLRMLATSREPMAVPGEVNLAISPLSLPGGTDNGGATADELMHYEAVRLFIDRARLRLLDFGLTRENAQAVARVCRKLDGIPLAIELATARMGALAVEQVAQRLEASLDVLKGNTRSAAPRQRTLRATLDWSHDLLSENERAFFRRLSVFAGGWTLEAAEEVCSGNGTEQEEVLDLVGGLVDKSLVVAGPATGGALRYRMLEPIRQYAREALEESGEAEEVRARHAAFFLALAEEAEPGLIGPQQSAWAERLEREHDNLREALWWVLKRGQAGPLGLRFSAALWRFWLLRSYWSEGVGWLAQALTGGGPATAARVKALEGLGYLVQAQGDFERARATYTELLELSRKLGDRGNVATALNSLAALAVTGGDNERASALLEENLSVLRELEEEGNSEATLKRFHALTLQGALVVYRGEYVRGVTLWEESLALARQVGDSHRVAQALTNLGYAALLQGDYGRAAMLCEEALALAHEHGHAELQSEAQVNLGLAARNQGDLERANATFKEAIIVSRKAEKIPSVINALEGVAGLAGATGEDARAARLWGAAQRTREVTSIALPSLERELHTPYLAAAHSRLGEAKWEAGFVEGQKMTFEEAVEYALSKEGPNLFTAPSAERVPADGAVSSLTHREREVATLVARGLTNRQIAQELSISERTAANHVAKILRKLGLQSRAQVASWETESRPSAPDRS